MKDSYYYTKDEERPLPKTDFKTNRKYDKEPSNITPNKIHFSNLHSEITQTQLSKYKYRSPIKVYDLEDYNKIKTQIKRGLEKAKQNISMNQSKERVFELQEYQLMNQQHRYQVESLLIQIQKLHETINAVERQKKSQIQKLKDQYEQISFLNLSNVRQNHSSQVDMLQTQLRKTKQFYVQKCSDYDNLQKKYERQTGYLTKQNKNLSEKIKEMIKDKNNQVFQIQKKKDLEIQEMRNQQINKFHQMNQTWQRQINSLNKQMQIRQGQEQKLKQKQNQLSQQNSKLCVLLDKQKQRLNNEFNHKIQNQKVKYFQLKSQFSDVSEQQRELLGQNYNIKESMFENQLKRMKNIIESKNKQIKNIQQVLQSVQQKWDSQFQVIKSQNQQLTQQIITYKKDFIQQTQILKLKLTTLHQNDLKQLVKVYQLKLQNLLMSLNDRDEQITVLRTNLYNQTSKRYENKQKFQVIVSQLNAKVIKLRSGLTVLEADMKQKIQNQKSMMLLTSRSLIKDVQAKATSNKFYQEELRKLRQLFDLQERQINQTNFHVQQKIRIAEEQLERLSKKVLQQKKANQQMETDYKKIILIKQDQIDKLQNQLKGIKYPEFDNSKQIKKIQELGLELSSKNQQIGKLKDVIDLLQKKVSQMKSQIQQYQMQHQISHAQAKEQYKKVSQKNMSQFKVFYQNRISELQKDKISLKQLISSKQQKFSELIVKYRQLQDAISEVINQNKKRTDLQKRVIQIGTDNNIVKNMSQIMRPSTQLQFQNI